jgi:hypothetical protein
VDLSLASDPSVERSSREPLIVELAGAPGSGKTTLVPGVAAALERSGWKTHTPESGARPVAATTALGRLVARLPSSRVREILLWRIYLGYRLLGAVSFVLVHPGRFLGLARYQRRRPSGALTRKRRVLFWYLRTAGAQEFFRRHGAADEAFIFDEGQAHRVVQLFSSPVDVATSATIASYIRSVPAPDLLVAVQCPASVCLKRVTERGVWPRLSSVSEEQLGDFITNAARVIDSAVEGARTSGWPLAEVANDGDHRDPAGLVDIAAHIPVPSGRGSRALYGARLLRPGRLNLKVRAALSRPDLAPATLDLVLDEYGLSRLGRPHNLAFALRSASAWVDTDQGRVVVRGYRGHWPDPTIRHEHSVLGHLESMNYPATRLLTRLDQDTITRVGEQRLAVFRFSEGVNLAGSLLIGAGGWVEASHLLGTLLARLHRDTADLTPQGTHHLSLDPGDPVGSRLASQLETLGSLAGAPATHPDVAWLQARAPEIERRLIRLAGILADADLEVAVIHGDFGFHNVLLRRDGGATVHDFELARRDWRLVDVVETISPMPPEQARHLLDGYRFEAGGEPQDWRRLTEMWEYHRLGGAVRSWQSYAERGDPGRLAAARVRVEEADRIVETGVGAWL